MKSIEARRKLAVEDQKAATVYFEQKKEKYDEANGLLTALQGRKQRLSEGMNA